MVTKALYVRLEAKPRKEVEVENFLHGGLAIVQQSLRQPLGLRSELDLPPSAFLMSFPTRPGGKLIFRDA